MELYDLEKRAIQIDIDKHEYDNFSENTDDNSSLRADDDITSQRAEEYSSQSAAAADDDEILQNQVSHVQLPTVGEKYHVNHDDNTLRKMVYGPTYVPYNEDGQKLLLPQTRYVTKRQSKTVI